MNVQNIFSKPRKWLDPVPSEYAELYKKHRLKNSVFRLRIFAVICLCELVIEFGFAAISSGGIIPFYKQFVAYKGVFVFFLPFIRNVVAVLFLVFTSSSRKKKHDAANWFWCYTLVIAFVFHEIMNMLPSENAVEILGFFFLTFHIALFVPDFTLRLWPSLLFYIISAWSASRITVSFEWFQPQYWLFLEFLVVNVLKISHYNAQANAFVENLKMQELMEGQRRFVADASHELKTPLSTLNTNLDILYSSQDETIKQQMKWLNNSKETLSRMTGLIQNMLELAKVDESNNEYHCEDVCVNDLLDEAVDYYAPFALKKNIIPAIYVGEDIHVFSNYNVIQQIVEILLDNAVKYANESGEIKLSASIEKNSIEIKVQNTGAGIVSADIDKIFNRFYRSDAARVYQEGSYGLGLPIAKSAAQKIGGTIYVQSNTLQTTFTLRIPNKKLVIK
jgi:signal transduction histidine kinase